MAEGGLPVQMNFQLHWLDWFVIGIYLLAIVGLGVWFGKFTKSTKDFFLGGQRFSWWVGSIACVATLVGSYSFLQYSQNGFNFGFSSVTAYTNDWFVLPLFLLVWMPIVYYSRITSIPEYFERRFDTKTRIAVLAITLIYLQGYIGINLYTIGVAIHGILGWNITLSAAGLSVLTGVVIYAGGATSVMMADLLQAFLLLTAGVLVFVLGVIELGGFQEFLATFPVRHQLPFANFNHPAEFHFIGDFWSDAVTGTIAFYFINQSVLMRVLSVKSVREARKTILFTVFLLMPIAAVAVSGGGWVARSLFERQMIAAPGDNAKDVFIQVARLLCKPGVFGFVMVAMLAALMSTLESLINAVSAVAVNDIWKPFLRPGRDDLYYLKIARYVAVASNVLGILLIPLFAQFASIYQALAHFTAITTPPLVVVILFGTLWKRFTPFAAFWTLILGSTLTVVSLFVPQLIEPIAHGEAVVAGAPPWEQHSYMRSLFSLIVCILLGIVLTLVSKSRPPTEIVGLVIDSVQEARRRWKGGEPNDAKIGVRCTARFIADGQQEGTVILPAAMTEALGARLGDILYVADDRWWLGGLRAVHLKLGSVISSGTSAENDAGLVHLHPEDVDRGNLLLHRGIRVEKIA